MARISQRLDGESEKELFGFFKAHVKFSLLHKSSVHGFSLSKIQEKCAMEGHIMLVVYNGRGIFMGAYSSKGLVESSCNQCDFYFRYYVTKLQKSLMNKVSCQANCMTFDDVFKIKEISDNKQNISVSFSKINCTIDELEVYRVEELPWTTQKREELRDAIVSFKPPTDLVTQTRVLLVGPVGAGKSSFISSVCSVLQGTVTCQTMAGMFRSYNIKAARRGEATSLVLCDMMGMGDEEVPGVKVKDVLEVIKGHVPERYKFNPSEAISTNSTGYISEPTLRSKIACVVLVTSSAIYDPSFSVCILEVPLVALLTHTDEVCQVVNQNAKMTYWSWLIKDKVIGNLLGLPLSCIFPVKNYSSELVLDCSTDILILNALEVILRYADLFYEDYEVSTWS
uniref:Interferon-induced protein 44-like n=1 Tax=Erpetoichthys calabaricus TaxID=27687 RepID=A0A8C4T034_ERPCA